MGLDLLVFGEFISISTRNNQDTNSAKENTTATHFSRKAFAIPDSHLRRAYSLKVRSIAFFISLKTFPCFVNLYIDFLWLFASMFRSAHRPHRNLVVQLIDNQYHHTRTAYIKEQNLSHRTADYRSYLKVKLRCRKSFSENISGEGVST
jgi:hypothetical protein